MIAARLLVDSEGRPLEFEASGHAGRGPAGRDLLCAAFTVLARTGYEALAALPGAELEYEAPEPGILRYSLRRLEPSAGSRAAGIADFLASGIAGLERDFPGELRFSIERSWRE